MKAYGFIILGVWFILTIIVILTILNDNHKQIVWTSSKKIKSLIKLNETTSFDNTIEEEYSYTESLISKRKLDNTSTYEYFMTLIEDNYVLFESIKTAIENNIKKYKLYVNKYSAIKSSITKEDCKLLKTSYSKFVRIENSLFDKQILRPILDTKFTITLTYTSPQGTNFYWKRDTYSYNDFVDIFDKTTELIENRESRQYQIKIERAKMSESLRYDILKRDNFKCQICGTTASDGAKLHIDHIIPVSKGGKTTPSNLRTLCDRCNLGKSDKDE